jgi:thiol:disulfide interchange protein DsbD
LLFALFVAVPVKAERGQAQSAPRLGAPAGATLQGLQKFGLGPFGDNQQDKFLDPEIAFVLSTEVRDAATVIARFDIADGYYLYRDKFQFRLEHADGVRLGEAELPPGKVKEDEYFGRVEVLYDTVEVVLPIERRDGSSTAVIVEVGYQGCAEAGLCYPPITKTVSLDLPPPTDAPQNAATDSGSSSVPSTESALAGELPEQDRLARSLATRNTGLVLLSFFGLGLLLTFTPCVLPLIPILSTIIVGQGEGLTTRRAFALSLTYVLAMAATYTAAGVLAGLSGANLQAAFQQPWILIAFSAMFVLLALAMFGFYELQVPASWQAKLTALSNRQRGGTYVGVGVMGFLSALIVGPCVAAPLAGALIYIAQTGDAVLGGAALFALSLGMGAPLLAFGSSAGKLLPRVGPWMNAIKAAFGVVLLGVAIYLLERIVPGWVALLLWAALFIVTAVYLGAFDRLPSGVSNWRRLGKGTGLVVLVYGVTLIIGAAGGGDDVLRPLKPFGVGADAETQGLSFQPVKGIRGLDAALKVAATNGQPAMLDFYADWCVSCKELERYTFSDSGVQASLGRTALLQADVTANDKADRALLKALGLFGPPAVLFFGPDGKERAEYRIVGFMGPEKFRAHAVNALGGVERARTTQSVSAQISILDAGSASVSDKSEPY